MDRLPPIPDEKLDAAQAAAKAAIINGPRGTFEGPFIPLLRSPELMGRLEKLGEYLRYGSRLPPRIREMAILIIARNHNEQTEWAIHHPIALKAGLPEATVQAIATGRRPENLPPDEQTTWDFLLELQRHKAVSDATYASILEHFGEPGVIDLTTLAGYYTTLALIMNVARTPPPPDTARLPRMF